MRNEKKPNGPKKRPSNRTRKKPITNKKLDFALAKHLGPLLLSLLIAFVAQGYRGKIINRIHEGYSCLEPKPGDVPAQDVCNAINFQHQIKENPNKKAELLNLLNDEVIWFRKGKKRIPKSLIKTNSKYDSFCYASYPEYDLRDTYSKNYEMRFVGYHRFREIDSIVVAVDKYFCKIEHGKISEIYSVPMNSLEKESFENNNYWYRNIFWATFFGTLSILYVVLFIMSLPDGMIAWIKSIISRFLPL